MMNGYDITVKVFALIAFVLERGRQRSSLILECHADMLECMHKIHLMSQGQMVDN